MRIEDQGKPESAAETTENSNAKAAAPSDKVTAKQAAAAPAAPTPIAPGPDGIVQLPPGVGLSEVRIVGDDLLITLSDGTQWIVIGGAEPLPQLALGQFQILPDTLASLISGQTPIP